MLEFYVIQISKLFQLTNINKWAEMMNEYVHISEIGRYKVHAPGMF